MSFFAALGAEFPLLLLIHEKVFRKHREIEQLVTFPPQQGVVLVSALGGVDLLIEPDGALSLVRNFMGKALLSMNQR